MIEQALPLSVYSVSGRLSDSVSELDDDDVLEDDEEDEERRRPRCRVRFQAWMLKSESSDSEP